MKIQCNSCYTWNNALRVRCKNRNCKAWLPPIITSTTKVKK